MGTMSVASIIPRLLHGNKLPERNGKTRLLASWGWERGYQILAMDYTAGVMKPAKRKLVPDRVISKYPG